VLRAQRLLNPLKVHSSVCTPAGSPEMVTSVSWLAKWLVTVAPFSGFVKTKVPCWMRRVSTGWLGAENLVTRTEKETFHRLAGSRVVGIGERVSRG
jgi:hypothetical protein